MRKYNIMFHGSIILFAVASLIISFMTLSKINTISNKTNENSTVYHGIQIHQKILQQMTIQQWKSL